MVVIWMIQLVVMWCFTRCLLQICFIFTPTWGNDPIWRAYFLNLVVQPPTSLWTAQGFSCKFVLFVQVPKMRIRKCSHVGGHKYAGNVMVYGKDHWHWQLGRRFGTPDVADHYPPWNYLKIGRAPKGNQKVFQPSIFRCENVSVREGKWDPFSWRNQTWCKSMVINWYGISPKNSATCFGLVWYNDP